MVRLKRQLLICVVCAFLMLLAVVYHQEFTDAQILMRALVFQVMFNQ